MQVSTFLPRFPVNIDINWVSPISYIYYSTLYREVKDEMRIFAMFHVKQNRPDNRPACFAGNDIGK